MIQIEQLAFGYSRKKLLYSDLSLNLSPGRIYGLLGKNGAGKSTLLKNIAGLLIPAAGSVSVFGEKPSKRKPAFLQRIYMIPEEVYTPPVSIKRYVTLFSPFYPLFSEQDFLHYLTIFEVDRASHLKRLSLGQRKKVIIAFAMACNTDLLILDEPTNGLDIPSKAQFRRLVAAAMTDKRTIIISTHQTRDLENLIDSVLIVDNGTLLLNASLDQVNKQLSFKLVTEVPNGDKVLFSEPTIGGYGLVCRNVDKLETRINLEYLFNTVTEKPEEIRNIFNP